MCVCILSFHLLLLLFWTPVYNLAIYSVYIMWAHSRGHTAGGRRKVECARSKYYLFIMLFACGWNLRLGILRRRSGRCTAFIVGCCWEAGGACWWISSASFKVSVGTDSSQSTKFLFCRKNARETLILVSRHEITYNTYYVEIKINSGWCNCCAVVVPFGTTMHHALVVVVVLSLVMMND